MAGCIGAKHFYKAEDFTRLSPRDHYFMVEMAKMHNELEAYSLTVIRPNGERVEARGISLFYAEQYRQESKGA
jgi:hypothetical protein